MGLLANFSDAVETAKRKVRSIKINPQWLWLFQKFVFFYFAYLVVSYVLSLSLRSDHAHAHADVIPHNTELALSDVETLAPYVVLNAVQFLEQPFWICAFLQCIFAQTTQAPAPTTQAHYPFLEVANNPGIMGTDVVSIANNTQLITVGNGNCVNIADITNPFKPESVWSYGDQNSNCVAATANQDGSTIYAADSQNGLMIIDAKTRTLLGKLAGLKIYGVALSADEKQAYVLRNGALGPEILIANVTDPQNPGLVGTPIKVPRKQAFRSEHTFLLKMHVWLNNIVVASSDWKEANAYYTRETGLCRYQLRNDAESLGAPVCQFWSAGLTTNGGSHTGVISNAYFSDDGKKIFIATATRFATTALSFGVADPKPGVKIFDNTNSTTLSIVREYFSALENPVNDVAFFSDEKAAIVADSEGIKRIDFDQRIPTDPPEVKSSQAISGGATNIILSRDQQFAFVMTTTGLKVFLLLEQLNLPRNVLTEHITLSTPILHRLAIGATDRYVMGGGDKCSIIDLKDSNNPAPEVLSSACSDKTAIVALTKNTQNNLFAIIALNSNTYVEIRAWNKDTPDLPTQLGLTVVGGGPVLGAPVFTSDGQHLFFARETKGIFALNATNGWKTPYNVYADQGAFANEMVTTRDNNRLYAVNQNLTVYNTTYDSTQQQFTLIASFPISITKPERNAVVLTTDEKKLFLIRNRATLAAYNITDKNNPTLINSVTINCETSQLTLSEDNRYMWLVCPSTKNKRVVLIDVVKMRIVFTYTAPEILDIFTSRQDTLLLQEKPGFIYLPREAGADVFRTLRINRNAIGILPAMAGQKMNGATPLTLKAGEPNTGKFIFYLNQADTAQTVASPSMIQPSIKSINGTDIQLKINNDGTFSAMPSDYLIGQTVTAEIDFGGGFKNTVQFKVVPGNGLTSQPATSALTTMQSTSSIAPTSAPTTPTSTTNTPVTTAQTESQTQPQTQSPTPIQTPAPPVETFPVDPFNPSSQPSSAPGVTASPNALQIAIINSKLEIQSAIASSEITFVALLQANLDTFKESSVASLGVIPSYRNGLLQLTGSVDDVNKALKKLSLSSSDNDPQRAVKVAVSSDGGNSWVRTLATLSDFEKNHAPQLMNATVNYANQTVPLDSPFSISLKSLFTDSDNDSLQYVLQGAPDWVSLRNGVISGRSSTEGIFSFTAYTTDGAAKSQSVTVTLTNQDILPTIDESLVTKTLFIKAGVQKDFYPIPRNAAKTIGEKTCIVTLADGSDLPPGIKWDADFWKLTVYGNTLVNYSLKFTVKDIYQRETSVTIPLSIVDAAPIAHQEQMPKITALAEKETWVDLPADIITDPDDPLSALAFTLSPKYSWAEFSKSESGKLLLSVTPPKGVVGQCLMFMLRAFDGYLSDAVNVTVCVPPHIPPVVNVTLPDKTVITGQKVEYRIPKNAFASDYPLTYSAAEMSEEGKATQLMGSLNLDGDLLFSLEAMESEYVGKKRIRITATDPLHGKASQAFTLTIDFSEWDKIKYWLLRIGVPMGSVIGALGAVWTVKEYAGPVISCLRGNVEKKNPFVWDAESQCYEYCIEQHKTGDDKIKYTVRLLGEKKLNVLAKPVAAVTGLFSSYLRTRITDEEIDVVWIHYDAQHSRMMINPNEIPHNARPVKIQIQKHIQSCVDVRYVYEEILIDPAIFSDTEMCVRPPAVPSPRASLEQPLLSDVPKKQGSEDSYSLGLTTSGSDGDSQEKCVAPPPKSNPLKKTTEKRNLSSQLFNNYAKPPAPGATYPSSTWLPPEWFQR